MQIKQAVDNNELHLTKECMVIALGFNAVKVNAHPVVVWPTCSKDEINIQMKVIQGLSDAFLKTNDPTLMCWSTDGDDTRRQIFDKLMQNQISRDSPIYEIISKLHLIPWLEGMGNSGL